jgi:hypothetical protein
MRREGEGRGCRWAGAMRALLGYVASLLACATAVDPAQSADSAGAAVSSDGPRGTDEGGSGTGATASSGGGTNPGSAGQGAEGGASGSGDSAGSRDGSGAGVDSGGQGNIGGDGESTGRADGGGTGDGGSGEGSGGDGSVSDGSGSGDGGACPAGLLDKVTTCNASSPRCVKGCGPDTATGNLGSKACSCNTSTLVYNCQTCSYPNPLPSCYQPGASPQTCASGVVNGAACATACGTVCTQVTDAGKTDGCVCIQLSSGTQWTCATRWW